MQKEQSMLGMACFKLFSSPPLGGEDGQCCTGTVPLTLVSCTQGFSLLPFLLSTDHSDWWTKCFSPFMQRHVRAESGQVHINTYRTALHAGLLRLGSWLWFCCTFLFKGEFSSVCFSQWLLPRVLSNASSVELLANHSCAGGLRVKASLNGGAVGLHHIIEGAWWSQVTLSAVPPKLCCFSFFKRVKSPHWTSRSSPHLLWRAWCRLGIKCLKLMSTQQGKGKARGRQSDPSHLHSDPIFVGSEFYVTLRAFFKQKILN